MQEGACVLKKERYQRIAVNCERFLLQCNRFFNLVFLT